MANDKAYFEYYAKLHIDSALKLRRGYFRKSERPDFVSAHGEVGLEVTRAVIEEWARQEAAVGKQFGKDISVDMVRQNSKTGTNDALLSRVDLARDLSNGETGGDPVDASIHIARAIERIEDKTRLLPEYQPCGEYWLYLFSETLHLRPDDITRIASHVERMPQEKKFKAIFIKVGGSLFVLRSGKTPREVALSGRVLRRIHRQAQWKSMLKR
ncbi:MAG: hypothetical protein ABFC31_07850 [Clostridiaceae bacterium]